MGAKNGREDERQLETLRKKIVGMLLAWHNPVSVTLKSAESSKKLIIRGKELAAISADFGDGSPRKLDIPLICTILSQAGFIEPSDWDTWVKTSARTPWVTIKGTISLQPAPSKQAQFLSIGIHPINSEMGSNILYDEINRLFALSSFGDQEAISDAEDNTKARKSKDGRFKNDGFTNKQLRGGGKGVDRWPMFYIRIDTRNTEICLEDDIDRLGERTISSLIEVLGAMITIFLEENHFRPRARLGRRRQNVSTEPATIGRSPISRLSGTTIQRSEAAHYPDADHNFGAWSRIKTGTRSKPSGASTSLSSAICHTSAAKGEFPRAKDLSEKSMGASPNPEASSTAADDPIINHADETFEWRNPISGATVLVNARTGLVIPPRRLERPVSAHTEHSPSALSPPSTNTTQISYPNKRLTRSLSNPFITPKEGSWSSELLKKWENPIFDTTEEGIPQVSFDGPMIEMPDVLHGRRHCYSALDIQKAFAQSSTSFSAKLSKQGLNAARVIAQVDKKFILICVKNSLITNDREDAELLVLVDQHAADERIRVEGLLADLKASPTLLPNPQIFKIQAREHHLLSRLAPSFAALGVVYDLNAPAGSPECKIIVKALPAAIAERCRLEPKVLIELIRSESWKCEEEGGGSLATKPCPQRLLDMLNSRACRSAIMFNDELTREECQTLIQRLGKCAFPFQCAHGRPSMVPLVDMGVGASLDIGKPAFGSQKIEIDTSNEEKGFGAAWRVWNPNG